mmetsp:Transcript_14510/g.34982  ORF Transcript_14510/g.34982 Transcript_14510/m.34982 type:complete len:317 (+) Transcript_14510:56-1006(+)
MAPPQPIANHKRSHEVSDGADSNVAGSKPRKLHRGKGTVQFSPSVSLRYCFDNSGNQERQGRSAKPSTWLNMNEVAKMKSRAKILSKMHRNAHRDTTANNADKRTTSTISRRQDIIANATRYEIRGESLRGMERFTDIATGRRRQRVTEEAIRVVEVEQREQLIQHVLESSAAAAVSGGGGGGDVDTRAAVMELMSRAVQIDASKLARVYGDKTGEAYSYARRVAREDAEIAASILAEDLRGEPSPSRSSPESTDCVGGDDVKNSTNGNSKISTEKAVEKIAVSSSEDMRVAAVMIKSLLPKMMSRHQPSLALVQA